MLSRKILIIIFVVVIVVAAAAILGGAALLSTSPSSSATSEMDAASSTVAAFGRTLQQVSILAPDASSTIASTYAPNIAPALLQQWEVNPSSAPGRVVSSPWPDHIQINSITPQGAGYVVDGEIVFMTSNEVEHGGNDGTTPIVIQLANENGDWQIVAFQGKQATSTGS